ncbi:hypothetical protein Pint_32800 [Pistacia integerrima]|uniref:Uncharacterized protein n=1 Tax=Pistacia integerrima TaxID=434235 RepID=A0ACC0XNE0_9ROSI|nr:hypothetical protein Pint_32800 [Pistacia integerrima]
MNTLLEGFSSSMNHLQFDPGLVSVYSNQNHGLIDLSDPLSDIISPSSMGSIGDSPDTSELSQTTLKYISEMLMEEDLGDKTCMLQDCMALQAAEKSFYDVLGQKYPPSPNQFSSSFNQNSQSPDDYCTTSSGADSSNDSTVSNNLVQPNWISNQSSLIKSTQSTFLLPNLYSEIQPVGLFSELREVSNSLPNDDTVTSKISLSKSREDVVASVAEGGKHSSPNASRGRKGYQLEDGNYLEEGRSKKHLALSVSDYEPSEEFDEVLLCKCENNSSASCLFHGLGKNGIGGKMQQTGQPKGSNGGTTRTKKKGKMREVVDLWTLLTLCAQAVASYDQTTATDLLTQIRQHSSSSGDGTQRLAHYFANGLEARLAGTQKPISTHLNSRASAADVLQAYRAYISSCPFNRMSFYMANRTIIKVSEKATRIHIIDFGIGYGFQWPCLLQNLSKRSGGPPEIRMTGIEFPQPGFRPAERVEETGRRLKSYCERFNVSFEYTSIAEKWQNIQLEDLKIDREEMTIVNSMYRMKHLPDDTVVISSPRDTVLELIKKINPDIFIQGVVNGTHNAPFFLPRFREALFHFSALFDMFEANLPREDQGRMLFEREIYGKDSMNVIACEGMERVDRPETYKQWQARNLRIGFRQLVLDKDLLKNARSLVKSNFHPDFVLDEVSNWMLQGWKGRLMYALSFWKPVEP